MTSDREYKTVECRDCGFIVAIEVLRQSKYDFPCPRCKRTHLSNFRGSTPEFYERANELLESTQ